MDRAIVKRRGSALLIVLGMLAFMVISAVAFSAYMRYSRLPSSFLRRTASSRLLVKAALAEAIEEIDAAIGNNPHPGVGDKAYYYPRLSSNTKDQINRNKWLGRVYIGCTNNSDNTKSPSQCMVHQYETVSPLCLEGLAYIPPPLVNEARYYSRRSNAGKWKQLPYDVGRYAFCAIDVSDYLDVNAVHASEGRSSSPNTRFSLAYLFENDGHTSKNGNNGNPADWDEKFMKPFRDGSVPLVSLADWNLALNKSEFSGNWPSPFCKYIENNNMNFYGLGDPEEPAAYKIKKMTFVTDGLFPEISVSGAGKVYDLIDPQNQPFAASVLMANANNYANPPDYVMGVTSSTLGSAPYLREQLSKVGLVALYDYLDSDHVPVSLSVPTTERVPMICGIEPKMANAQLSVAISDTPPASGNFAVMDPAQTPPTRSPTRTVTCTLQPNIWGTGGVAPPTATILVAYPFRHKDNVTESFTLEGGFAIFLTTGQMNLRPAAAQTVLHFVSAATFSSPTIVDNSIIILPFDKVTIPLPSNIRNPSDAVVECNVRANLGNIANGLGNFPLLDAAWGWTQNYDPNNNQWAPAFSPQGTDVPILRADCKFRPLRPDGSVDTDYAQSGAQLIAKLLSAGNVNVNVNVAIFAQIKDKNGNVVDQVPACGENDTINGSNNWNGPSRIVLGQNFGDMTPLMRFDTGAAFSFSDLVPQNDSPLPPPPDGSITIAPKAVLVGDPRYNYAPESWFKYDNEISKEVWLSECGATDNDGDIFMQVSDQGYLQSVYELANIPRFGNGEGFGDIGNQEIGRLNAPSSYGDDTFATKGNELNHAFMWRTYDPFDRYCNGGDGFEELGIISDGGGLKINPYSDSTNVMMAAFANTPHEWRVASTNNQELGLGDSDRMEATEFNADYAWNQYSSGGQIHYEDLEDLAGYFMEKMREGNNNWEEVWRDLGWYRTGQTDAEQYLIDDIQLQGDKLYNTDKKFLYGYWHDCFAVKQQLFLIFVRAEPMMMGGGAANQTPPQLGAKAVALVWRDPTATKNEKAAHKTRILFYRQFD